MKTKTIKLYEFDELPEDIKEKVLDKERYINVEHFDWWDYDGHTGFSAEEIKKHGLELEHAGDLLTWNKMYFSLDYGEYIQFNNPGFAHDETARRFLGVPKKIWENTHWEFINHRETTTRLSWEYGNDFLTDKAEKALNHAVNKFYDKMKEALKDLRSEYEYCISDEAVIETIKINEYTFRADGKMENE